MRAYLRVRGGQDDEVTGEVVREQPLTVYVNGEKFLMLLGSPMDLEALVIGYLWLEKIIGGLEEIRRIEASAVDGRAEVTLARSPRLTNPGRPGRAQGLVQVGRAGQQGRYSCQDRADRPTQIRIGNVVNSRRT
jgi:formate dehydrogenase accessory protein FdhD